MDIQELYSIFQRHPQVATDTRHLPHDALFFALRGARFDGNVFAPQALKQGCACAVVDEKADLSSDKRYIRVPDVLTTLQQLATYHRRQLGTPILQITGTNGKTTTKELIAAVLSEQYRVLATEGNLNNQIGVPLTLLRLRPEHQLAVIETGASHPGDIAELCRIVEPDCGLITNCGRAHLEGFGSFEGVVHTKGELYDWLRCNPRGYVFLHSDDPTLKGIATGLPHFTYGAPGSGCDIEGEALTDSPLLHLRWRQNGGGWQEVQTHLVGAYNLPNALAAVAVGLRMQITPERISHALASYEPRMGRSQLISTEHNRLVVDAYNANPTSMEAALTGFAQMNDKHKMAILGEMRELGAASAEAHRAVARRAARLGLKSLWLVGKEFAPFASEAGARYFSDVEAVKAFLSKSPVTDSLILIKGSNGTHLYELPPLL